MSTAIGFSNKRIRHYRPALETLTLVKIVCERFAGFYFRAVPVPVVRPDASRNVMVSPERDAVPVVRPELSRNVVVLPLTVAVPVVFPLASRKVVFVPLSVAVPVVLPVASR